MNLENYQELMVKTQITIAQINLEILKSRDIKEILRLREQKILHIKLHCALNQLLNPHKFRHRYRYSDAPQTRQSPVVQAIYHYLRKAYTPKSIKEIVLELFNHGQFEYKGSHFSEYVRSAFRSEFKRRGNKLRRVDNKWTLLK